MDKKKDFVENFMKYDGKTDRFYIYGNTPYEIRIRMVMAESLGFNFELPWEEAEVCLIEGNIPKLTVNIVEDGNISFLKDMLNQGKIERKNIELNQVFKIE